jgi:hypothetical protein
VTGRCLDQTRTCHRRNLSVRPSAFLFHPARYDLPSLEADDFHRIRAVRWEFICNLGFEMSLLRSRRQWRWTAAVSSPLLFPSHRVFITTDVFFSFFPTVVHCLSLFHHITGSYGSRRFEFDEPIQLQGTPFSCFALPCLSLCLTPPFPPRFFTALVDLLSRMCLAASISAPRHGKSWCR